MLSVAVLFAVLLCLPALGERVNWHGYDENVFPAFFLHHKEGCSTFHNATRPYSASTISKMSLWSGVASEFDLKHGETLYGSEQALLAIHRHQNPDDCSQAKFLISGGWGYGFGSRIHMEGVALGIAMELGRVYLPHPDGDNIFWETNVPHCKANRTVRDPSLQCFYLPFSKCTVKDALKSAGINDINKLKTLRFDNFEGKTFANQNPPDAAVNLLVTATSNGKELTLLKQVPSQFVHTLTCSPLRRDAHHYWWRAVSATYLLRPNQATREVLAQYGEKVTISDPRACVAMFVRHGDKGSEMKLLDFSAYRDTAVRMWNEGLTPATHATHHRIHLPSGGGGGGGVGGVGHQGPAFGGNGTLFITTEDASVLAEAEKWALTAGWSVLFTALFDRASSVQALSHEQLAGTKNANSMHHELEYLSMLLNLELALRCESWVCTLASNSCRVIDELRCTVGAKCNRHYADLSGETCSAPPCLEGGEGRVISFGM